MAGMMRLQQQLKCLREGSVVGKIARDQPGAFVFTMERYAAHTLCQIKVRAICEKARVVQLIVSPKRPRND